MLEVLETVYKLEVDDIPYLVIWYEYDSKIVILDYNEVPVKGTEYTKLKKIFLKERRLSV
jgi:hypothetical protein